MAKRKPQKKPQSPRRGTADRDAGRRLPNRRGSPASSGTSAHWLYGVHAVLAALANPQRRVGRLVTTAEAAKRYEIALATALTQRHGPPQRETTDRETLAGLLPDGAVHQGIALACNALSQPSLDAFLDRLGGQVPPGDQESGDQDKTHLLVALDQVTDPHNVGAILRSAAAFGALGILATRDHAAPETGVLAKAASGALEQVPYLQVTNLARALDRLREADFWALGLAADSQTSLADWQPAKRTVLILGAEGSGMRRLTRERCDQLVRLPTRGPIDQLNVSNAAAVALYELSGRRAS